jgi:signal transduction histidine kinase
VLAEIATLLAHEIRNPLGSMELFTRLLVESTASMPETRRWANHWQAGPVIFVGYHHQRRGRLYQLFAKKD